MLTDVKCRTEKAVGGKEKKISDGFGLYLLVRPSGTKLWQMAYRFNGRQKKLSFGIYGADDQGRVSLATARKKRDEAKALIAMGIDPGVAKKEERLEKATACPFASWADEWLAKQEAECGERTMKGKRRFVGYLKDQFGSSMIGDITVESVVAYLKTLQDEGKLETRDRVRAAGEDICKFADLKRTGHNPFRDLGDFLIQNVSERRPAITEPINAVAQLFQDIAAPLENSRYGDLVGYALRFLALTAVRPGEVNNSEWTEIDWERARWTISAAKMKMDKDHVVPLSRQALEILKAVHEVTGNRHYIFSCTDDKPLSNNTLNKRLRVIGYDTADEHCAHGFRSTFSTLCHQEVDRDDNKLWDSDVVELCLAHLDEQSVKAIYNKVGPLALIGPRTKLMQHWADRIDAMVDSYKIIPINRPIRKRWRART
jgi:integrase